jgi:hypothetical protein
LTPQQRNPTTRFGGFPNKHTTPTIHQSQTTVKWASVLVVGRTIPREESPSWYGGGLHQMVVVGNQRGIYLREARADAIVLVANRLRPCSETKRRGVELHSGSLLRPLAISSSSSDNASLILSLWPFHFFLQAIDPGQLLAHNAVSGKPRPLVRHQGSGVCSGGQNRLKSSHLMRLVRFD